MKELESVGCAIENDIVYPMFADNTIDYDNGVEVTDLDEDFIAVLSAEDYNTIYS